MSYRLNSDELGFILRRIDKKIADLSQPTIEERNSMNKNNPRTSPAGRKPVSGILADLSSRIIGQPKSLESIVPYVRQYQAGLSPEGRPAGVFLLLGPTGTGKTRTVEALAEVIHGSHRNVLRIDCGEFQMEHEVCKLIGAPPGYLGHRETQPLLTQSKLNAVMSERANLAIVLFDEIEKAAPSLQRLLLGILDKGTLTLGDNTKVNFERTLVFMTSNLGARELEREIRPTLGLGASLPHNVDISSRLEELSIAAAKRFFSPEFMNRLDSTLVYRPLSEESIDKILELELAVLGNHLARRLGDRVFYVQIPKKVRKFLISKGFSPQYGARELKRTLQNLLIQPLAELLCDGKIGPGDVVTVRLNSAGTELVIVPDASPATEEPITVGGAA